jgi:hypothetical protein
MPLWLQCVVFVWALVYVAALWYEDATVPKWVWGLIVAVALVPVAFFWGDLLRLTGMSTLSLAIAMLFALPSFLMGSFGFAHTMVAASEKRYGSKGRTDSVGSSATEILSAGQ